MTETPIESGNALIDSCFDLCVKLLLWLADLFGVSYNTINIWIFCVLWPLFTVALILIVVQQARKIRSLKRELKEPMKESKKSIHGL
jgi:hypothetical protein